MCNDLMAGKTGIRQFRPGESADGPANDPILKFTRNEIPQKVRRHHLNSISAAQPPRAFFIYCFSFFVESESEDLTMDFRTEKPVRNSRRI